MVGVMRIAGAAICRADACSGDRGRDAGTGVISETKARGTHAGPMKTNIKVHDTRLKFQASDSVDVITQEIGIPPGGTTGWHSHPGLNFNSVKQGTVTLYHGDDPTCTGETFAADSGWFGPGLDVHLARNEDSVEEVVLYSTFVVPDGFVSPTTPLPIDEPAPENCPS